METTSDAVVLWNKFLKYCGISLTEMTDTELTRRWERSLSEEGERQKHSNDTSKGCLRQRRRVAVRGQRSCRIDAGVLLSPSAQVLPSLRPSCRWLRRFCLVCSGCSSTSTSTTLTAWARWGPRLTSTPATSISITLSPSSTSRTTKSWSLWWVE